MRGDPVDARDNVCPDDALVGRLDAIDGDCAPNGVLVFAGQEVGDHLEQDRFSAALWVDVDVANRAQNVRRSERAQTKKEDAYINKETDTSPPTWSAQDEVHLPLLEDQVDTIHDNLRLRLLPERARGRQPPHRVVALEKAPAVRHRGDVLRPSLLLPAPAHHGTIDGERTVPHPHLEAHGSLHVHLVDPLPYLCDHVRIPRHGLVVEALVVPPGEEGQRALALGASCFR